ncbi:rhodanese-like domain-containing protein [Alphaproteobacteria bacterium]|nr:rhodanese-like domain-containing protein [Alphaproteobacteria bacterium]
MLKLITNIFTKYKVIPFIFFVFFINTTIYSKSMFTSLSIEESKLKIEEGLIIVDVREESEFNESRIPNSHLIPLNTISKELLASKFGQNVDIIIHCRSGKRSKVAAEILTNDGYEGQIFEIDTGIIGWIESGQTTISN